MSTITIGIDPHKASHTAVAVGEFEFGTDVGREAAIADHYWQIWGLLLPVAIAIVISGVAIRLFSGSLVRILAGRRATMVAWIHRSIVPLAVVASVPYWFGPEIDDVGFPGVRCADGRS